MIQYAKKLIASTKEMPLTSPIRKGLIQIISKDVRVKDVAADLGVTPPTIYNALNSAQNLALSMASRPNQKRARVEDVDIELAIQYSTPLTQSLAVENTALSESPMKIYMPCTLDSATTGMRARSARPFSLTMSCTRPG